MRQTSIPKNFVDALNAVFYNNPRAVDHLIGCRVLTDAAADQHNEKLSKAELVDGVPRPISRCEGPYLSVLDLVNAALDSVAPGKRVATIHGPDGLDGFVLGRDKKPTPKFEDPFIAEA